MADLSAQVLRATGKFSVAEGLEIATAATTTAPYRLAPHEAMKIARGAHWRYPITLYAGGTVPTDLSGYHASFMARTSPGGAALILLTDAGAAGSAVSLGTVAPNIQLELPAAATEALSFVRAWGVLTVEDPAGRISALVEGFVDLV